MTNKTLIFQNKYKKAEMTELKVSPNMQVLLSMAITPHTN